MNELLGELRPHAGELVDAFAIPERVLRVDAMRQDAADARLAAA